MIETYPNFIDNEFRHEIKEVVYKLQQYYRPVVELPSNIDYKILCACTLGNAIYAHGEIDKNINKIVRQAFSELHHITIKKLQDVFGINNIHLADFSVPGFHIFRGYELNRHLYSLHYHKDISIYHHKAVDYLIDDDFVYSFISIIENTDDPSFLDYKLNKHYYNYNELSIWNARLPHRIGDSKFGYNDSRITYQGHIFKVKNKEEYYLYF